MVPIALGREALGVIPFWSRVPDPHVTPSEGVVLLGPAPVLGRDRKHQSPASLGILHTSRRPPSPRRVWAQKQCHVPGVVSSSQMFPGQGRPTEGSHHFCDRSAPSAPWALPGMTLAVWAVLGGQVAGAQWHSSSHCLSWSWRSVLIRKRRVGLGLGQRGFPGIGVLLSAIAWADLRSVAHDRCWPQSL